MLKCTSKAFKMNVVIIVRLFYQQFYPDCANGTKEPANISSGSNNLQMTIVIICVILLIAILLLVIMFLLYRRRALCFGKKKQSKKDKVCVFLK